MRVDSVLGFLQVELAVDMPALGLVSRAAARASCLPDLFIDLDEASRRFSEAAIMGLECSQDPTHVRDKTEAAYRRTDSFDRRRALMESWYRFATSILGWYCDGPDMTSDLLKLRTWLTLREASNYLSSTIDHDVRERDIVQLALDDRLQLSVKLLKPIAAIQDCEGAELAEYRKTIEGVWDLLLKGPVRLELEKRYGTMHGPPYVERDTREGAFVTGKEGVVYQLPLPSSLERVSDRDRSVLPVGTVLGVRRQVLDAVLRELDDATDPLDNPLGERERTSLLTIIAALARKADLDISKVSKAGGIIERWTIELDARVSARAIEDHLKRIPDALERRDKSSN